MALLLLNAGSSGLKFSLMDPADGHGGRTAVIAAREDLMLARGRGGGGRSADAA